MKWLEVCIFTATAGIEPISGQLLNLGVNGWVVEDPQDFQEFLRQKEKNWDYIADDLMCRAEGETKITCYLADNQQGHETLRGIEQALKRLHNGDGQLGTLRMTVNDRDQKEWEDNWKQYYKPFLVGEKLVVKPSWERYQRSPGETRKILEIDPNASFGTGQHHTTKLCLETLETILTPGCKVLDIGCGTGILSVAAMLLGAGSAVAVDIEEHSKTCSMENAQKNGIPAGAYTSYCGNVLTDEALTETIGSGYDLILANIVADVIIAMAPLFYSFLRQGGAAICSGIIEERQAEVEQALQQAGFTLAGKKKEAGWVAMVVKK